LRAAKADSFVAEFGARISSMRDRKTRA